jgi:hypothetical protein
MIQPSRIAFVTLHVRRSPQAVPLAAATVVASLPPAYRATTQLIDGYLSQHDDEILSQIFDVTPHCVAFSLYVWNKQRVLGLAQKIRATDSKIMLIVGGPEATACAQQIEALNLFDVVVSGEGERIFSAVIQNDAQQAVLTEMSDDITPIKGIDLSKQVSPWLSGVLKPEHGVLWETSRGCPFQCAFCYDARGSSGVREIPFDRLEKELKLFVRHGVSQVWVLDSTFNFPAERGKKLLRLLIEHAPQLHYHLEAKAEFLDLETVTLLQQICCSVQVGLQSARPQVLKHINRSLDVQNFSDKVKMLSEGGITFGIDLIYGLPHDDYAGLCESINYALEFCPNHVEIFPLALLPGTKLYDQRDQYGLQALTVPPYTVTHSSHLSPHQFQQCRALALACDLFYNTGRSMAYFLPLCRASRLSAVELLDQFSRWLVEQGNERTSDDGTYSPEHVFALQQSFIEALFHQQQVENLIPIALDLIRFHTHWSNTLLGPETLPCQPLAERGIALLDQCWCLAPSLRVESFNYDVEEIAMLGDVDLVEFVQLSEQCGSMGLFLRRGEEVYCESIDDVFATLLVQSDGKITPAQILAPFSLPLTAEESADLVHFAVSEGLLIPPSRVGLSGLS